MGVLFVVNMLALLLSFFVVGVLVGVAFSRPFRTKVFKILRVDRLLLLRHLLLKKSPLNPILRPGKHPWTAEAVLNPAAALSGGRTHLIYRAIGIDGISRLGYASSPDGILFDQILPYPIYVSRAPSRIAYDKRYYSPMLYPSGGSWGGCEDPRMVVIDGWVYVTFNMFHNWTLRVAVIMMREDDFIAHRFHRWQGPIILSHGTRDKNWVLFPERINGQFAVLHSIIGETDDQVRIEYTHDLSTLSKRRFDSPDPQKVSDRPVAWHTHVRSAGPPPLRTDHGWLVLYHAHDTKDPSHYKVGAMLLDLSDPSRVLHRAQAPVIAPSEHYENDGKPGIVYSCGAVVDDGVLYVYYGGGDKVVCVATTHLETFLDALIQGAQPQFDIEITTQTS